MLPLWLCVWAKWQRGQVQMAWTRAGLPPCGACAGIWCLWVVYFPVFRTLWGASLCQGSRNCPLSRKRRCARESCVASRMRNSSSCVCKRRGIAAKTWQCRMLVWSSWSAAAQDKGVLSLFSRRCIICRVNFCMFRSRLLSSVTGSGLSFNR